MKRSYYSETLIKNLQIFYYIEYFDSASRFKTYELVF
jgi:hypothetical protein